MTVSINRDEWLTALKDAGLHVENDPKAVTIAEFCVMFDLKPNAARERLEHLVSIRTATRTHKRRTTTAGQVVSCIAYRLRK